MYSKSWKGIERLGIYCSIIVGILHLSEKSSVKHWKGYLSQFAWESASERKSRSHFSKPKKDVQWPFTGMWNRTQDTSQNKIKVRGRKSLSGQLSQYHLQVSQSYVGEEEIQPQCLSTPCALQRERKPPSPSQGHKGGVLLVRLASVSIWPGTKAKPLFELFA